MLTTNKNPRYISGAVKCVITLAALTGAITAMGQTASLKTNLLYDATTTPNVGLELSLSQHQSVQLFYGLNPWEFTDTKKLRHWSLTGEYRYWLNPGDDDGERLKGWFAGLHALGGEYNAAGIHLPLGLFHALHHNHYEGWYAGGGLTLGHAWRLADRWRLEASVGVGLIHTRYEKYENVVCGDLLDRGHHNYIGPTKLALNLAYTLGKPKEKPQPAAEEPAEEPVPVVVNPEFHLNYIVPQAEPEKSRELSGQAFLDFPVNKTTILPDYRNNQRELQRVKETIDIVKADPNTTIRHIGIHGYASPEGGYQNNARLAEGRAQAFRDYVQGLIDLSPTLFSVASTPEDWDGLLAALNADGSHSATDGMAAVRAIAANATLAPDERERQLKSRHPAEWKQLLAEVFPALRHSDYTVTYTVRPFSTDEARDIIRTKPQQLSLNEMFLVAQTYLPGSPEFSEVFEIAVRLYPDDETANLNAAITALTLGNLTAADRYLQKAGYSPEAQEARRALDTKRQNPDTIVTAAH